MAQVGRISGPLLTANLERQGKDIDFRNQQASTPLLKLKVGTNRIGVNTTSPAFELDVVDTIKGNFLNTASLTPGNINLSTNNITALTGPINFKNDVVASGVASQQILMRDNTISTYVTNAEINLLPNGTGTIELQGSTNVTGNLNASGNITFDGNLVFGDTGDDSTRLADTVTFNADIETDIVPDVNNSFNFGANYSKWSELNFSTAEATNLLGNSIHLENGLIELTTRQGNTFYVDKNGNNNNVGDHPNGAFLTLAHALSFVDSSVQGPVVIHVSAGDYEEVFPLTVPANVTIIGEDMRNVVIKPTVATNTNNAFLLDGETTIENITVKDYFSPGYAFSFKSNATVTSRSPYIRNVTVITKGSVTSVSDPRGYDQGDAGKGVLVDGASVTSSSQEASMLFHSVTFITPGVESVKLTNGVRVEWLNSFIYFAQQGVLLERGSTGHLSTDGSTIQYGAEMRCIGSANVYGEYGIKADGAGTNAYLINHNFTYIGTGKSTANDDTLSIHENEIEEINSGRVNFTTVDEQGNYRVGSALFVNQDTGKTEIQSASIDFSNTDSLTIVTAGSTVTIDDSRVRTDFIRLRDNKLESLVGNLKVDSALNTVNINANTNITGNLDTAGNATISGSLVSLGDADTDNISFNSDVTSGMTPNVHSLFNLGSTTKSWRTAYAEKLTTDIFDIEGNRLTTKDSNEDLELVASGTGKVKFGSLITEQAFTQTDVTTLDSGDANSDVGVTDNININLNSTLNNVTTPTINANGFANFDSIGFVGNRITTNESNADLVMAPAGTGKVYIPGNVLVENTIIAPTANYSFSSATMQTTSGERLVTNNISLEQMIAGDILLEGNVITTRSSNTDLDFRASGTGKVILDENVEVDQNISVNSISGVAPNVSATDITANFANINTFFSAPSAIVGSISLAGNRIQTIDSNADLEFNASGTGRVILDENISIPNLTVDGNTDLQVSTAPSATFDNATITNNIIAPSRITMEGVQIFGNKIQTKSSDSDLDLRASGTGVIRFKEDTNISQNLTVNGTLTAHNIGIAGDVDLNELETDGNIEFNDNYVTTTVSNSNLELRTSGGAFIDLQGIKVRDNVIQSSSSADPEYNNGAVGNVTGNGSDFFKREATVNGVRVMAAGAVGGQTAVPDAWIEKVARMFELFLDPTGAGINSTFQRNLIKTLSGDAGTYHAGLPTIQRVARGAGSDYSTNFLTDAGIVFWNLTDLFDNNVQNDMVWYLNSTGDGYGVGDIDAQEVIEHVFHTLHMHGLPADDIKLYSFLAADWQSGDLYAAMEEAYDAGKWDPSGYQNPADDWKTNADAFEVAAKEYLFLLNFAMFEYTELWDGGSLSPEWTDDMRTQAGIQTNNPLGYAFHNTYIAPVISKPSLATIRSIFGDGNTPAQDNPALAGVSGYVVSTADIIILDPTTNLKIDSTDSMVLPNSLTDSTNTFSNNIGAVQYNSDINQIVGLTNSVKRVLGPGLYSDDLQTFVNPNPDNTIEFTAQGVNSMTTSYGATTMNRIELSGIDIDGNTLSTNITNSDLILLPEIGQGKAQFEDLHVLDSTITNTSGGAASIGYTDNGYVKFNQTTGMRIPAGTTGQRIATPEVGTTRWNVALGNLEVYGVGGWTDASGSGATVSAAEMDEIMNEFILIFG